MRGTKRIKAKKGFTLTELLISLVLFALLAGAVSSIILVSFNIYSRSALRNTAQRVGTEVFDLLENRLSYGKNVTITNSEDVMCANYGASGSGVPSDPMVCITVPSSGDRLCLGNIIPANATIVKPDELSKMKLLVEIEEEYSVYPLVTVRVSITSDDGETSLFSTESPVRLLNVAEDDIFWESFMLLGSYSNEYSDLYIGFTEIG